MSLFSYWELRSRATAVRPPAGGPPVPSRRVVMLLLFCRAAHRWEYEVSSPSLHGLAAFQMLGNNSLQVVLVNIAAVERERNFQGGPAGLS